MEQNTIPDYQYVNHHPGNEQPLDTVGSVLHSVCAAKGCSWKDAYTGLIRASGALGQMPQNRKAIRNMLENQGFYLQAAAYAHRSIDRILAECNEIFHDGEAVILNISGSTVYGCYIPLVPVRQGECVRYVMQYPENLLHRTATEVWIAWKDGQDHSIMPRRKAAKKAAHNNKAREHNTQENN
ncbi:MAG: hypothetical protein J5722_05320, partial [Oscillospiraceae bacterium]|nr:hypothetical protein [Oscillospiraceae bacterium]